MEDGLGEGGEVEEGEVEAEEDEERAYVSISQVKPRSVRGEDKMYRMRMQSRVFL